MGSKSGPAISASRACDGGLPHSLSLPFRLLAFFGDRLVDLAVYLSLRAADCAADAWVYDAQRGWWVG